MRNSAKEQPGTQGKPKTQKEPDGSEQSGGRGEIRNLDYHILPLDAEELEFDDTLDPSELRIITVDERGRFAVDTEYLAIGRKLHSGKPHHLTGINENSVEYAKNGLLIRFPVNSASDEEAVAHSESIMIPYLGPFGFRTVLELYRIANDPPNYRASRIEIDVNDLLDRLGYKRDNRGIHRSANRKRLRDILLAASKAMVVSEIRYQENGRTKRKVINQKVIEVYGGVYDEEENRQIPIEQILHKGLPEKLLVELKFYDTVRDPVTKKLGTAYTLMALSSVQTTLPGFEETDTGGNETKSNSRKTKTAPRSYLVRDALATYLLLLCQHTNSEGEVKASRQALLKGANITTRHSTRANQILQGALDKLVAEGIVTEYRYGDNKNFIPTDNDAIITLNLNPLFLKQKH